MISVFAYGAIAVVTILLVVVLARPNRPSPLAEEERALPFVPDVCDVRWLELAKQIFDSADYLWLRDELRFPRLAEALFQSRKSMALCWLRALRASFNELVRTPDFPLPEDQPGNSPAGWRLSWLTVRFQLLVNYALLMVWLFGPYHRLIPALNWHHLVPGPSLRDIRLRSADSQNL